MVLTVTDLPYYRNARISAIRASQSAGDPIGAPIGLVLKANIVIGQGMLQKRISQDLPLGNLETKIQQKCGFAAALTVGQFKQLVRNLARIDGGSINVRDAGHRKLAPGNSRGSTLARPAPFAT